jgi:hypothetical protein
MHSSFLDDNRVYDNSRNVMDESWTNHSSPNRGRLLIQGSTFLLIASES